MYSKAQYEKHLEAIEAANSCISAALVEQGYGGRITKFIDDFTEISEMFWAKCPVTKKKMEEPGAEVEEIAGVFVHLVQGNVLGGFQARKFETILERCQRKCKGKLLGTRLMMMDKDAKANCADKENHTDKCKCKPLTLFNLAQKDWQ